MSALVVKLSKQDAAERLLVQAVKLHFNDGDPFAIHLLLMSSMHICRDVCKHNGTGIDDEFQNLIKPGKTKEFFAMFYSIASYFKHADKDVESLLDFPPDLPKGNESLIMLVTHTFEKAFNVTSKNFFIHIAKLYYIKMHPMIVIPPPNEVNVYDQMLGPLDSTTFRDSIRTLVRDGPSFLGPQPWINDWTW
jgi:hypothetical protein